MKYSIPADKRTQVDSLIKEFTEHIQIVLDSPVRCALTVHVVGHTDIEMLKSLVSEHFDIEWNVWKKPNRTRRIVAARSSFMWLCHTYLEMGPVAIGNIFGMHHTTVMHSTETIDHLIETKEELITTHLIPIIKILNDVNASV